MSSKKLAIGVVAGVAILATVSIYFIRRNKSSKKQSSQTKNLAETYNHKLSNLERKAKREFKNLVESGEEVSGKINGMLKRTQTNFQ